MNEIPVQGREKDVYDLCKKVLDTWTIEEYNPSSPDVSICPLCRAEDTVGTNIKDIEHSQDCAYLLARDLLTGFEQKTEP